MRNIKLILEYDGADFFGFQKQPHHPTIQQALEDALFKFFRKKIKITAASGRTDTAVSASYQVVNFKTNNLRELSQIQKGLNAFLPRSIAVKEIEEVSKNFHARYSARSKTYEYFIWNHPTRSPLHARRSYHVPYLLDIVKMRKAAQLLTGKHDFRSFCTSSGTEKKRNAMRTIKRFEIKREGKTPLIRCIIEADGFLYHMVRNLIGALTEVGSGKLILQELKDVLKARDRRRAGTTVPAHALTLVHVTY